LDTFKSVFRPVATFCDMGRQLPPCSGVVAIKTFHQVDLGEEKMRGGVREMRGEGKKRRRRKGKRWDRDGEKRKVRTVRKKWGETGREGICDMILYDMV